MDLKDFLLVLIITSTLSCFLCKPINHVKHDITVDLDANYTGDESSTDFVESVVNIANDTLRGIEIRAITFWQKDYPNMEPICKTVEWRQYLPNSKPVYLSQWSLVNEDDIKQCKPIYRVFMYFTKRGSKLLPRLRRVIVGYSAIRQISPVQEVT
ncbi:uncharacterized protein [Clytia hemisphaerica]|uniref:uncharacterized protein n=1 Tax=Clytia hemisphaerica TaxID=252671 RepID=UPI0034D5C739|eukprot:TCONS_00058701-protein